MSALAARQAEALAASQHANEMTQLLIYSGVALAIMAVLSVALGWVVAGRVLRPLRTITEAARNASATSLHERLALSGPDDELKKLGDTFDELLGRLAGAFDAQRRFIANASHELRTPLTLGRALLQMTLTDPDATVGSFRSTCGEVIAVADHQERLIEALLVLARSERGLDHREPVDLSAVTGEVLAARQPEAQRLGLWVTAVTDPARIEGDARLAERLVANLVDNALRHNTHGGRIEVATGSRAGRPFVAVANTGPVVAPGEIHRLFEPFQRLGADSAQDADGLGLGLSIVQAIATAHDAILTALAQPGGGLDITVSFPASNARTVQSAAPEGAVASLPDEAPDGFAGEEGLVAGPSKYGRGRSPCAVPGWGTGGPYASGPPATVPFAAALVGVFAPPVRCPRSWSGSQTPARWPSANPTNDVLIWTLKNQPGQLERLRSDRHNVPVLIGEHDPSPLQPALIGHQPAHRRRPVPARIMTFAPVPAELTNRQPGHQIVNHHALQRGIGEVAISPGTLAGPRRLGDHGSRICSHMVTVSDRMDGATPQALLIDMA